MHRIINNTYFNEVNTIQTTLHNSDGWRGAKGTKNNCWLLASFIQQSPDCADLSQKPIARTHARAKRSAIEWQSEMPQEITNFNPPSKWGFFSPGCCCHFRWCRNNNLQLLKVSEMNEIAKNTNCFIIHSLIDVLHIRFIWLKASAHSRCIEATPSLSGSQQKGTWNDSLLSMHPEYWYWISHFIVMVLDSVALHTNQKVYKQIKTES